MEYSYPLLERVLSHYSRNKIDVSDFRLYSCMHLLEPQYEMYKRFIAYGFKPKNIFVLGKAYSSNGGIIQELGEMGVHVSQPTFSKESFDNQHAKNCAELATRMQEGDFNIILDDGAYLIHESREKKIVFAVEQTSSGFRKLEQEPLTFPIFNVARSKTKLTQESPIIARQIFERSTEYVGKKMAGLPKVMIVGLGPIGDATLQIFQAKGHDVTGFDIETAKERIISHMAEEKPDIVIGATGSQLFSEDDMRAIENDHTYYLMSVSSSDREFPVAAYRQNEGVHEDVVYKNLVFVNNGFPITFIGLRNELTPVEIEKTIALLMGSVLEGITNYPKGKKGFVDVPEELQTLLNS